MLKEEIEAMSFDEKLAKLKRGIEIPPPERVSRNLNEEKVFEIASQYITRGSFKKGHPTAYRWACRKGVIDEMCEHMVLVRKPRVSHARSE
jgi:hypothetical protein